MFLPYDLGTNSEVEEKVQDTKELVPNLLLSYEGEPFTELLPNTISVRALTEEFHLYGFDCRFLSSSAKGILIKIWNLHDGQFTDKDVPIYQGLNGGVLCRS